MSLPKNKVHTISGRLAWTKSKSNMVFLYQMTGLWTGILPSRFSAGRIEFSKPALICAGVLMVPIATFGVYESSVSIFKLIDPIFIGLFLSEVVFWVVIMVLMLVTSADRVRCVAAYFDYLEQINNICGAPDIMKAADARTVRRLATILLSCAVVFCIRTCLQILFRYEYVWSRLPISIVVNLMVLLLVTFEALFGALVMALVDRMEYFDKTINNCCRVPQNDSDVFLISNLETACEILILARKCMQNIFKGFGLPMAVNILQSTVNFIVIFYSLFCIIFDFRLHGVLINFALLMALTVRVMVLVDPCERLACARQRVLETMERMFLKVKLRRTTTQQVRNALQFKLNMSKNNCGGGASCFNLFQLSRKILVPIAGLVTTYIMVLVQIHQGAI